MEERILLHLREGSRIFKKSEIIENARRQERAGVAPRYVPADDNALCGWLVWSTFEDGAGVVCRLAPEKYCLVTGRQGDFLYKT